MLSRSTKAATLVSKVTRAGLAVAMGVAERTVSVLEQLVVASPRTPVMSSTGPSGNLILGAIEGTGLGSPIVREVGDSLISGVLLDEAMESGPVACVDDFEDDSVAPSGP